MSTDIPFDFVAMNCGQCGCVFYVPAKFKEERQNDHTTWYCPSGHPRVFRKGQSDLEKERAARQLAEQRVAEAADNARAANARALHQERRASTFKGHCTRIKKRVKMGSCPCGCDGVFKNLRRHMLKMHPDWTPDAEPTEEKGISK